MSISHFIKEIGRGKDGARSLSREQAADLMGQVLDGHVSDLELGAFCLAMRIKGETADEMAGFLDATHARLAPVAHPGCPTVVLPSYNGARRLPVLTPLLAGLLAREGLAVLVHGHATEDSRVSSSNVLSALAVYSKSAIQFSSQLAQGQVNFLPTEALQPGLARLLDVRRVVGLRNPGHSLVKLLQPVGGPAVVVSCYTHPEYLQSMAATLTLTRTTALLLRGTEGEPVADARRTPAMDGLVQGTTTRLQAAQEGPLLQLPDLPATDAAATAAWTARVLAGELPPPAPIARQVQHLLALARLGVSTTAALPSAQALPVSP
jgi:anthranilate phosphoribosyltransferase